MKSASLLYKTYATLIIVCFGFSEMKGQCTPDHFMKHYMGNAAVYTNKVITTPQDDIVAMGSVLKINGDFLDATDGWITKLSPRGTVLWAKRYLIPGFNSGGFYSIENATDSSYLVTGRFGKYIKRQFGSWEEIDAATYLFHIDKFGYPIWTKRISQYITDSYLSSITKLQDGNFLIAGNIFNSAGSKLLLLNIDLSAKVNWYKLIFSDSSILAGPTVKQLNNGMLVLSGITQKSARNFSTYDQGYYFTKFDANTGDLMTKKGIYINTSFTDLPTGHDNIKNIIELNNDTIVLCSSFSGDRLFGATPGTKEALLLKASSNGQFYKADGYFNTQPGCRLLDAKLNNGNIHLLLDNGYTSFFTEVARNGSIVNQKAYGNIYSLLKADRFLSGSVKNRVYYNGRAQYPLMGLMKTEDDASIPCMESPLQMVRNNASSFFRNGNITLEFINVSFPFAFDDIGGLHWATYNFETTTDCIVTCCDNIRSDTTYKEFCNQSSYRLPDNSIVRETGLYYVNRKNANNCDSIAYYDLKFMKTPDINLGNDTCFKDGLPILLRADTGYANYNWSGLNTTAHTFTATMPGTYSLSISNQCGTGKDEIIIYEDCEFPVYMPTAFTPNNDGLNDIYRYPSLNKNRFLQLKIFNRYGQEVFKSDDQRMGWDGKLKNKEQPAGVYVYLLEILTLDGRKILRKGSFTLIR
jgi:gliding motility-associated-like protein